jgi:hypothetical protein
MRGLFSAVEWVFHNTADINLRFTHIFICEPKAMHRFGPAAFKGRRFLEMEVEFEMTGKITAIITTAVLIASAGVASAQSARHVAHVAHATRQVLVPDEANYHFRGDAPAARPQVDPLTGTVFEGVAPY